MSEFQVDNRTPQQKGNDFEITVFNKLINGGIRATLSRTSTHNFLTDRTEFTGDGGIDIYATFHEIPILIQCKCLQKGSVLFHRQSFHRQYISPTINYQKRITSK